MHQRLQRGDVATLQVDGGERPDAWEVMERHVALILAGRDPQGFAAAMRKRALMAWLQAAIQTTGQSAFAAVSPGDLQSLREAWSGLSDDHPPLVKWYDDWERAEALTEAALVRWTCRTSPPDSTAHRKA
jgi:hypothetical protein